MPITQSRMLALIRAGQDYQQALAQLTEFIRAEHQRVQNSQLEASAALASIYMVANGEMGLATPTTSAVTLAVEAKHFRDHQRGNNRRKQRQEARRGTSGGGNAPSTMAPAPALPPSTLEILVEPEKHKPPEPSRLSASTKSELDALVDELLAEDPSQ